MPASQYQIASGVGRIYVIHFIGLRAHESYPLSVNPRNYATLRIY